MGIVVIRLPLNLLFPLPDTGTTPLFRLVSRRTLPGDVTGSWLTPRPDTSLSNCPFRSPPWDVFMTPRHLEVPLWYRQDGWTQGFTPIMSWESTGYTPILYLETIKVGDSNDVVLNQILGRFMNFMIASLSVMLNKKRLRFSSFLS